MASVVSEGRRSPRERTARQPGQEGRSGHSRAAQGWASRCPERQASLLTWLQHPAEVPPVPSAGHRASVSPLLPQSVSQDPGAPLHIHASPWKENQACQAGLRSQDSKFYSWLCHSLPPTSGARHFPPGKQIWLQGSSWSGG